MNQGPCPIIVTSKVVSRRDELVLRRYCLKKDRLQTALVCANDFIMEQYG